MALQDEFRYESQWCSLIDQRFSRLAMLTIDMHSYMCPMAHFADAMKAAIFLLGRSDNSGVKVPARCPLFIMSFHIQIAYITSSV